MAKVGYIHRYLAIIQNIRSKQYIDLDTLIRVVQESVSYFDNSGNIGVSERTIRRDIKDIRENLLIDIQYSKKEKGYYVADEEITSSDFDRILESLNLLGSLLISKKVPNFVFAEKRKSKGIEQLMTLIDAIKRSIIVEFSYIKYDNTLFKEKRVVQPYALKEFKNRWYLLAVEIDGRIEERGQVKTWGLDRIQNLYITNKSFSKSSLLNIEKEFNGAFGIFSDKDKQIEEVILSFTLTAGKYNESLPLHESQETLIDNDKEFRIKLDVKLTYDFIMELLAQGENMKVISPNHLRERLISIHKKAIALLEI